MKTFAMLCAIVLTATLWIACDNSNSNTVSNRNSVSNANNPSNAMVVNTNTNANMTAAKDDFWSKAAIGGMAEVELGKLASSKAQNADVKQFAQMMVTDHSKANDELKAVASKKNVTLPTSLDATHQSTMQKLQGLSGAEFDQAYVDEMLRDHQEDVQMFEKQAEDNSDADAKAFAAKTLPTLRKHLDAIKSIQAKMQK